MRKNSFQVNLGNRSRPLPRRLLLPESPWRKTLLILLPTLIFLLDCSLMEDNITLTPYGQFSSAEIRESSGLVQSRQFENVFWTHNDHGDIARIFATTAEGELIREVRISGADHVDWEDIAADDAGHLYIGDFGNNRKNHKQRTIYMLREPNPFAPDSESSPILKRVHFAFPDHKDVPVSKKNKKSKKNMVDCEALFWANGNLYCLTKHRKEGLTKLYRFAPLRDNDYQVLTKIAEFDIGGAVTGADASPDGSKLVVLCYDYIYLFEKPANSDNYLAGAYKRIPFSGGKSEGICFAGPDILFSNEESEIYKLPQSILTDSDAYIAVDN